MGSGSAGLSVTQLSLSFPRNAGLGQGGLRQARPEVHSVRGTEKKKLFHCLIKVVYVKG